MLKSVTRELALAIQARSGASTAALIWLAIMAIAAATAFVFLCVSGYDWLADRFGGVRGGLIMATSFAGLAVIAAMTSAMIRHQVRRRASLARAAHSQSWLLDPRLLATAAEAGRSLRWQRIASIVLIGLAVAQLTRDHRAQNREF